MQGATTIEAEFVRVNRAANLFSENFVIATIKLVSNQKNNRKYTAIGNIVGSIKKIKNVRCRLTGKWQSNEYGMQFKFTGYEFISPIETFLNCRAKGIPKKTIEALLKRFTQQELEEILEHNPSILSEVKGIRDKRLHELIESWRVEKGLSRLRELLAPLGVPLSTVTRLFENCGGEILSELMANPYRFALVEGIGFKVADQIAARHGVAIDSSLRIESAVEYLVRLEALNLGNTVVDRTSLSIEALKLLTDASRPGAGQEITLAMLREAVNRMIDDGRLMQPSALPALVSDAKFFEYEREIIEILSQREALPLAPIMDGARLERFICRYENFFGNPFSEQQKDALRFVATGKRNLVIRGYAGTGKTTVVKTIIKLLQEKYGNNCVVGMALSGVAARRLEMLSGCEAGTIHRIIGVKLPPEMDFLATTSDDALECAYNRQKPLPWKIVILDEASMVNSVLFGAILRALAEDSILLLVGDDAQLPPIGPGNIFEDLNASDLLTTVTLTKIFRQDNGMLLKIAHAVRTGCYLEDFVGDHGDFSFESRSPKSILKRIVKGIRRTIEKDGSIDGLQFLAAIKDSSLGVNILNATIQQVANPLDYLNKRILLSKVLHSPEGALRFKCSDRVVHIRNKEMVVYNSIAAAKSRDESNASKERIYNGLIGKVVSVNVFRKTLIVAYQNSFIVEYEQQDLGEILDLAFCLSVHKSQGNEFPQIIMPIVPGHVKMLNSKMLYTAITRAKSKAIFIGDAETFRTAARDTESTRRSTVIQHLLPPRRIIESEVMEQISMFDQA